jgi:hypothetical protein
MSSVTAFAAASIFVLTPFLARFAERAESSLAIRSQSIEQATLARRRRYFRVFQG